MPRTGGPPRIEALTVPERGLQFSQALGDPLPMNEPKIPIAIPYSSEGGPPNDFQESQAICPNSSSERSGSPVPI